MADKTEIKDKEEKITNDTLSGNNEIKETTGSEVEIYDEDDDTELPAIKKKKFKKKYVIIPAVILIVIFFIGSRISKAKNAIALVETMEVNTGVIENVISVSGTVESAESKTYFSDITAPIDKVNVKVGDRVSAGDILYTYKEDSLDLAQKNAELTITQAEGSYSALYSAPNAPDRNYAQGMTPQQINDRLDAIQAEIDGLNNQITEKMNRMSQTLTDLQKVAQDINQNGIADGSEYSLGVPLFDNSNTDYIYRNESGNKEDDEFTEPTEHDRQMSLAVSQSIADVSYAIQNDTEIQGWKNQITTLSEEQAHLNAAKGAQVNPGTAQASKAQMEAAELSQNDQIEKIEAAKEGIKADFNGVVTAIPQNVVDGATVTTGTMMLSVANLDKVQVRIQVSKSDLPKISEGQQVDITINGKDYEGVISTISGNATRNANGVAVVDTVIEVTNPDSDIILGVEANNKIHAEKAENTIVVPYQYVQTDAEGDYVYVLENGLITRRDVTIGIANSTEAEITEGLEAGESIIISDADTLVEGTAAVVAAQ